MTSLSIDAITVLEQYNVDPDEFISHIREEVSEETLLKDKAVLLFKNEILSFLKGRNIELKDVGFIGVQGKIELTRAAIILRTGEYISGLINAPL